MLEVDNIDVFYGPVQALRGLSLTVGDGEMVALLGANGAGKTTTLRAISGLLAPKSGTIRLDGREVSGLFAEKIVRLGVAHMPEGRELFADLSVIENLKLGHWPKRKEHDDEKHRIEEMFDLFPRLRERATQPAATLSGGEQQMLTVARALMSSPTLLLVDELSLGLAPIIVQQLFETLAVVNRAGCSVLLVEQFVQLALQHTARAYVLAKGRVAVEGASKDLLASPEVMEAYLGEVPEAGSAPPKKAAKKGRSIERTAKGRRGGSLSGTTS